MIEDIGDTDEASFLRHWSERVWDRAQLAQIAAIEQNLTEYALTAWRSMRIDPPQDVLLIGACEDGLVLMTKNTLGDWRTRDGLPHKPPMGWMPAPHMPKRNGRGIPGR